MQLCVSDGACAGFARGKRAAVRVDRYGLNLNFPALDVDLYVPALVSGIFGTRAWVARELARIAGHKTPSASVAAPRANGAKEGRPSKVTRA